MADEFEIQLASKSSFDTWSNKDTDELEKIARVMVAAANADEGLPEPIELCLRLTSDDEVRRLNCDFRGFDMSTDVLAFALREAPGGEAAPHLLGDIVISIETAARQAKHGLAAELCFLFAHGLCHLLGYDHQSDAEEMAMNARSRAFLVAAELERATVTKLFER